MTDEERQRFSRRLRERDAENEQLRAALEELVLRHDLGGTNDQILVAWNVARQLLE